MMAVHQLDFGEGRTELLGFRMAFMPTHTLANLVKEMYEAHGDEAFDLLFRVGQEHGHYAIDVLGREHKVPKKQFINELKESANVLGLGAMEFKQVDLNGGKVVMTIKDSPFVEEFRDSPVFTDTDRAVDDLQRGMIHGIVEELVDYPVTSTEDQCALHGGHVCRIIVRPDRDQ